MLLLTIIEGLEPGRTFELPADEPQLIGRSSEALPITDQAVSRRHAELTPDRGAWFVRDLASQNGTYLNGTKLTERAELSPGDLIRVGSTVLMFGSTSPRTPGVLDLLGNDQVDAAIEAAMAANDDSMVLAEPEPSRVALEHLRIIYRLTTLTAQLPDRTQLLGAIMELIFNEFEPDRGVIMLETEGGSLEPEVVRYAQAPKDQDEAKIKVSRTIVGHAIERREGVLSSNAMADPRFSSGDSVQHYHIRSAICVPIHFRERTYGAIYIDSSIANYTFTQEQLALMNAVGQHTALALANNELYAQKLHAERLAATGETVASLSHSVKNIIQGMRGGADVVDMGIKRSDLKLVRNGWEIVRRNLDRISNLTMNMLAYSRQRQVEYELTPIGPLIDDCAQLHEASAQAKQVALIVDHDPEMPPIPVDPHLLHQALMNLIGNAIEAVEAETGHVTLRTTYHEPDPLLGAQPPYIHIDVIDNGPGVPPERRARIFEPFHTTKGIRGTGLGLAVTKRVVDQHRGSIELESAQNQDAGAAGGGATFRIVLPADQIDMDPSATTGNRPSADDLLRDV